MAEVSVPCGSCGKPIRGGDDFCEACGSKVDPSLKTALRDRLAASDADYAAHKKKMSSAQGTIGALAILFVIGGAVFYFITRGQVDDALQQLAGVGDAQPLNEAVGSATTVGELRSALQSQPYQVLGLNLFLAAVMAGLWVWSKRALLPAIITALGIYVAVQLASAMYDPKTLAQGMILKVIVIVALVKGVQSALAAQKVELAR
ncbi:MAG: zinc ribbon domain-containing protein [Myxococcales bacterium]|nr:MAG: zinc ribbon domain-containing protein [Myxococcales bacterium]